MSFKSAVITFPGSNCDRDALSYLRDLTYGEVFNIWHEEISLPKVDLVILPGGFSFGDYLRSGAMASKSNIINEVINHANGGRYLLGICNGFQILTETGLLKGALIQNKSIKFLGKDCYIKKKFNNKFNCNIQNNEVLQIPVAHNEGNFYCDQDTLNYLQDEELIAFEYCNGEHSLDDANINGSLHNIAGITNENRNILGMMPHPERAYQDFHASKDGKKIIESILS
ncbi:phosphoribosylformylglycinamidine synthase subunit PurQ [Alphaproteobacteria bacterium]|jgi:phosphoribosylformylglycinamidine synthase|nr:phosphoribosylformylglycinamidine synthase subunit PurQ [Alphaproteobacteria bacterium]